MKLWPYDQYQIELSVPPDEVITNLKMYLRGTYKPTTYQVRPFKGKIDNNRFEIEDKVPSRLPKPVFQGEILPSPNGSIVKFKHFVDMKMHALTTVVAIGVVAYNAKANLLDINTYLSWFTGFPILPTLAGFLYLMAMVPFWMSFRLKPDVEKLLRHYNSKPQLESID